MKPCWIAAVAAVPMVMASALVPALADEAPASKWVGSAGVVNDYLFRGMSQTNRKPAVQAGVEFDHAGGWYLGGWGSNVSWLSDASTSAVPVSNSVELDLYGGYRDSFGELVELKARAQRLAGVTTSVCTATSTRAAIRRGSPCRIPPRLMPR